MIYLQILLALISYDLIKGVTTYLLTPKSKPSDTPTVPRMSMEDRIKKKMEEQKAREKQDNLK